MEYLAYFTTILLGLAIGSFLNVLILRLPREESWLKKARSFCPLCDRVLKAVELIPVVSFLIQRGKCGGCKKKISWQYPAVELATVVLFMLAFLNYFHDNFLSVQDLILMVTDFLFIAVLIVVFVIDVKHFLIIPKLIYPMIPIAFILNLWGSGWSMQAAGDMIFAGLVGFLFYWIQHFISKGKWVGGGDMKLALLLGVMLGMQWLLMTLLISYVVGALIAIILLITKKMDRKSQLPMAAFLAPVSVLMILYGNIILDWYIKLLL